MRTKKSNGGELAEEITEAEPAAVVTENEIEQERIYTPHEFFSLYATATSIVTILRHSETGALEVCCEGSPSVIDSSYIQKKFGGGKYTFRLREASGRYIKTGTFALAALPPEETPPAPEAAPITRGALELELMREQINRQHEMLLRILESKNNAPSPPQTSLVDVINAVGQLRALSNPQTEMRSMISALTEGMKLVAGRGGSSPNEPEDKMSAFLRVADQWSRFLPNIFPRGGQAPAQSPVPPGENVNPSPARTEADNMKPILQGAISYLKTKVGKDTSLWAEWIMDNLEQTDCYALAQLIEKPWPEIVAIIGDSEIDREPFKSWFQRLMVDLKSVNQSTMDTDGQGRHSNNLE